MLVRAIRQTSFNLLLALGIIAALADCSHRNLGLTQPQRSAIAADIRVEMTRQHIPGLAIGIARDGESIYANGFGLRAKGQPVGANTVFPVGSITKQFTAACVMLLVQQGRVDLESAIARYLPKAPHANAVTVRELLNQTSGLADYSGEPALQRALHPRLLTELTPSQLLGMIAGEPLHFKPGTKFEYSNTNYLLAGMIVAAVSGESYPSFLREHIIGPLHLQRTSYLRTSIADGSNVSDGYEIVKGHFVASPRFTMSWAASAGALASDTSDLIAWDNAFFGGRVVPPASVRAMTTPPSLKESSDYGFGWVVDRVSGEPMIWHNGALPGAHAMNAVFPRSGLTIVILTNILTARPEEIAEDVFVELRHLDGNHAAIGAQ